jgi:hypothetical protein
MKVIEDYIEEVHIVYCKSNGIIIDIEKGLEHTSYETDVGWRVGIPHEESKIGNGEIYIITEKERILLEI